MQTLRTGAMAALLGAALGLSGCAGCDVTDLSGEDENTSSGNPSTTCEPQQDCPDRESFRDGRCQNTFCESDAECCPSTRCDLAFNLCRTRLNDTPCETDVDCELKGQACTTLGGVKVCAFPACESTSQCADGLSCFKGRCVGQNPCPQGCAAGEVCDVATGSCHPALGKTGCDVSCAAGTLQTLTDPATMSGEVCCAWECECAPLPPLAPGIQGTHASVAVAHVEVAVANYDQTYGDLVVNIYDRNGTWSRAEYVDGFPPNGAIGGDVRGPRGGITDPGDDVGRYASAVTDALGRVHVAYYDKTHGALKYALRDATTRTWTTHVVDDGGDAGLFASLAIRPVDGLPVVSYLVLGLTDGGGRPASAVRVATAGSATPTAGTWTTRVIEQASVFDPCNHACGPTATCVLGDTPDAGSGAVCRPQASACTPACSSAQACVSDSGAPACLPLASPPIEGLPRAVGLFTSVAAHGTDVVVTYYDAVNGNLKAVPILAGQPGGVVVVDGDGVGEHADGDVGAYSSVAYDANGKLGIVYWDATAHDLRFYLGAGLTAGRFHVVDTGRGSPPGLRIVGADAELEFGADGTAYVVYQEQTSLNLVMAQRDPDGTWSVRDLLADQPGAYGFYATAVVAGTRAYVASVKAQLDERQAVANVLGLLVVDVPN